MRIALVVAFIILGASGLILVHVLTYPLKQFAEKHKSVTQPIAEEEYVATVSEQVPEIKQVQVPKIVKKEPARVAAPIKLGQDLKLDLSKLLQRDINPPLPPDPGPELDDYGLGLNLPKGLPSWFKLLDTDEDGQITRTEWRKGGKKSDEFRKYDLNGDGLITADEVLRYIKQPIELKLEKGQAKFTGTLEATDQKYQGNKISKFFTINLEKGKTYQIDHMSQVFDAYLYLEDPDGKLLAEDDDGGEGRNSRIIHRAAKTGAYRLIATSLGNFRPGAFSFSVREVSGPGGNVAKGLPSWFKALDKDGDGQLTPKEWQAGGKKLDEFREYDLNGDGVITTDEVLRSMKKPMELKLEQDQVNYNGVIEEASGEKYQGKKTFRVFTIKLEQGKTYQIDYLSQAFYAYLYLENADGKILNKNNSGGTGKTSRIIHKAAKDGTYRLIATSQDGYKTGAFSLSVRVVYGLGVNLPKGLPSWFKDFDKDGDGQITLNEWREGGKKIDDFRSYDVNGDGIITADEVLRYIRKPIELKLEKGQVHYTGAIEANDEKYKGKKTSKIFTIHLEKGKTYQIDLMSEVFDAYLYLENSDGKLLAQDDDSGEGKNARIVYRPTAAGTYRVIATSSGSFRPGDFSLLVRVRKD